jgi:chromosome segregation ATPase
MPLPGVDQAVVQRLFERLSDLERGFADRLAALEASVARHAAPMHTDLSPLDSRLSAIESALHARANGDAGLAFDAGFADRLATIEEALATERSERASAITALSDEISGVRSAVRLAAQNSEAAQSALTEQLQQIAATLEQQRFDLGGGIGDRVAAIEESLNAHSQRLAEAQAVYSAELTEVHDALMKIGANHQTLAGAIDNWRSNDSGEIHLINARIGAVHEDGSKRLAAIEKLCADVETLSHLVLDDRTRQPGSFKRWLLGTEDWVKASWRPPAMPRPSMSRPKWTRVSWRLPFSKRRSGTSTNG